MGNTFPGLCLLSPDTCGRGHCEEILMCLKAPLQSQPQLKTQRLKLKTIFINPCPHIQNPYTRKRSKQGLFTSLDS